MGMINRMKESLKKELNEVKAHSETKEQLKSIDARRQREDVKAEIAHMKEIKSYENDKRELQKLKNETGVRGKVVSGLKAVREHLVKVKKNQPKATYKKGTRQALNENLGMRGSGIHNQQQGMLGSGMHTSLKGSGNSMLGEKNPRGSIGQGAFGSNNKGKKGKSIFR